MHTDTVQSIPIQWNPVSFEKHDSWSTLPSNCFDAAHTHTPYYYKEALVHME